MKIKMKIKKFPAILIVSILALLVIGITYYVTLPPINPCSSEFWTFFFFILAVIGGAYLLIQFAYGSLTIINQRIKFPVFVKVLIGIAIAALICILLLSLISSQIFRAKTYSNMIELREGDFASEVPLTEYVTDIALMDSSSAQIIGARTLGTLSDLVSQYTVSPSYTQIAIQGVPYKVAPLEYASFFKWLQNSSSGIPGYVKVDPVNFEAEFIRLDEYITVSPSAYFSKNLMRAFRFAAPFDIFGSVYFEIDDNGHPYWIASTMKPYAGWFGAYDVSGVLVMDACTGETTRYELGSVPAWIDIVYDGYLICQKYDWYGMLKNGYFNSVLAQTGCTVTTDDFGYKIIGNDVYIFTGVTSTSNDEANIGFILANSRTGEYKFFSVPGAEEYSAMSAAEGSVQQYGYRASFPSLINVGGEATYIMVLKDASGIVKMYSMVNVRNYNIVVTSETQDEVFQKYKTALAQNGNKVESSTLTTEDIVIDEIIYITQGGETTVYIKSPSGVYGMSFNEDILFYTTGDTIKVAYTTKNETGVTVISRIEK